MALTDQEQEAVAELVHSALINLHNIIAANPAIGRHPFWVALVRPQLVQGLEILGRDPDGAGV